MRFLAELFISLPPILWALTVHEFSHALAATKLGDPTPRVQGRLTLNPIAHIDLIGFLALLVVHFGWAKPVMINPLYFRRVSMKLGNLLVAVAGPLSNFASAFIFLVLLNHFPQMVPRIGEPLAYMLNIGVFINVAFGVFNLLPIPPLDGYKVFEYFLPRDLLPVMRRIEPYGSVILLLLVFTPLLRYILVPLVNGVVKLMLFAVV